MAMKYLVTLCYLQWAQMFNEPEPRFMKFNYGPEYNLTKINVPTFYISGGGVPVV